MTYSLYIENGANEDLEVVDVYTSNPTKLDVDDIDYPDTVPDLSVRTVRIYLEADSVNGDMILLLLLLLKQDIQVLQYVQKLTK